MRNFKYFTYYKYVIAAIVIFLSFGFKNEPGSKYVIHNGNLYYLAHTVVIQLKSSPSVALLKTPSITAELNKAYGQFNFTSAKTVFNNTPADIKFGLNRIMFVKYNSSQDPLYVAAKLKGLNDIEWAEPKYVRRVTFVPNDPFYSSQYYLGLIEMPQAWDISQGDTSVVIGIVDTGVDWPHPDLYANIWHNPHWRTDTNFPGDSIGWDFGGNGNNGNPTPDNNPIEDKPAHGTLIAGVSDAVTNNNVGIAGIGIHCKIMAVKTSEGDITDPSTGEPYIVYGFEGIKYAADNGAKVINCSWGGGGYSQMEQDIINYAISKGSLVVAAAGNDGLQEDFYPASYNGVISVAATDANDVKAYFSNYGPSIDVAAPGDNILSTWQPNSYQTASGTSLASPIVSGIAALVSSKYPSYTPLQVGQQIRVNCDDIYAKNSTYQYLLGSGRVNAYNALSNTSSESVRAVDAQFSDAAPGGNNNGAFEPGETLTLSLKFMNYLKPINSLNVSLQSLNSYSTINNGSFTVNNIATLDSFNNSTSLFKITLAKSIPLDSKLLYKLNYADGSYSDFQLLSIHANPSYSTQAENNVALTVTSKGALGFNDYPNNLEGDGFKFQDGPNFLFEGALLLGTSATKLSDESRDSTQANQDTSFKMVQPFLLASGSQANEQIGTTVFNDDNAGTNKLGVTIKLRTYSFNVDPDKNFIILRYDITNNSGAEINNLYVGDFFDWDMIEGDGSGDYTSWDDTSNLAYVYHINGNPNTWIGTALISSSNYGYWAINNNTFGYTKSDKWKAISSGIGSTNVGPADIAEITSGGPFNIKAGGTLDVAFAITAGNNLNDLRTGIQNARTKYGNILTDVTNKGKEVVYTYNLFQNYPNPFNPSTKISYQLSKNGYVTLKVYDILGNLVKTIISGYQTKGNHVVNFNGDNLASGVYFYRINAGNFIAARKMLLIK